MSSSIPQAVHLQQVTNISYDFQRHQEVNPQHTIKEKRHSWTRNIRGITQTTQNLHCWCPKTKRRLSPHNMGIRVPSYDRNKLEESTSTNTWYPSLYTNPWIHSLLTSKRHQTATWSKNQTLPLEPNYSIRTQGFGAYHTTCGGPKTPQDSLTHRTSLGPEGIGWYYVLHAMGSAPSFTCGIRMVWGPAYSQTTKRTRQKGPSWDANHPIFHTRSRHGISH